MADIPFSEFPKISRLSREVIITEKLDGTNASIMICEDGQMLFGSRSRWITPADDNYGFAAWAAEHDEELRGLGIGHHFGEWWGRGIQRNYSLPERRFSLFNTTRWLKNPELPGCCHIVPELYRGPFHTGKVDGELNKLVKDGSIASPGFMKPEGVVVFHTAANICFKKTVDKDEMPKTLASAA